MAKTVKTAKAKTEEVKTTINDVHEVKFNLLKNAVMPFKAHPGDIGMDITATDVTYDSENDVFIYKTGIRCETSEEIGCFVFPRSSNCYTEAYMTNSVAVIDTATYRGEIQMRFKLRTSIEQMASTAATERYEALPWYKKIFNSKARYGYYIDAYHEIMDNVGKYAPYKVGDKIGQLVFFKLPRLKVMQVDELSVTDRGAGGFGSTGK